MSTSGAEAKRCERGLYGGSAKVCAVKVRYNFWQTACQIDIRGGGNGEQRIVEMSRLMGVLDLTKGRRSRSLVHTSVMCHLLLRPAQMFLSGNT